MTTTTSEKTFFPSLDGSTRNLPSTIIFLSTTDNRHTFRRKRCTGKFLFQHNHTCRRKHICNNYRLGLEVEQQPETSSASSPSNNTFDSDTSAFQAMPFFESTVPHSLSSLSTPKFVSMLERENPCSIALRMEYSSTSATRKNEEFETKNQEPVQSFSAKIFDSTVAQRIQRIPSQSLDSSPNKYWQQLYRPFNFAASILEKSE